MLREGLHYLAGNEALRRTARANPAARRLAARFVAGETLADALSAVRRTNDDGMTATLDHLGENVGSYSEAGNGADSYVAAIDAIGAAELTANISCKLTHLGLDLSEQLAEALIGRVAAEAKVRSNFVRIDMESSRYTEMTVNMTKRVHAQHGNVGIVIQSCLYRSADDVRDLNQLGIRIRLVKGAYLEPASVAFPHKRDVDDNYRRLTEHMLSDGEFPAFATHDELLIDFVKRRAGETGRKHEDFEFQMLYGIRRDLQKELRDDGYRVRLYIPYGTQWYPYLMRRLAERPANLLFVLGNVAREARGA